MIRRTTASSEELRHLPSGSPLIKRILVSGLMVMAGAIAFYFMQEQLRTVFSSGPRLRNIRPWWFVVMLAAEMASFGCLWWLTRIVLPNVSWFIAATSQLVSNAVSRVIPGGAATGGAVLYRMLAASGVDSAQAGGAMAASSILTTAALVAVPAIAGLMALAGAPIPESLLPAALAGGILFLLCAGFGAIGMAFDRPLIAVERGIDRLMGGAGRLLRRDWGVRPGLLVGERNRLMDVLGARWPAAIGASAGKWAFDYLASLPFVGGFRHKCAGRQPRYFCLSDYLAVDANCGGSWSVACVC